MSGFYGNGSVSGALRLHENLPWGDAMHHVQGTEMTVNARDLSSWLGFLSNEKMKIF